jgi:hypothetical protein
LGQVKHRRLKGHDDDREGATQHRTEDLEVVEQAGYLMYQPSTPVVKGLNTRNALAADQTVDFFRAQAPDRSVSKPVGCWTGRRSPCVLTMLRKVTPSPAWRAREVPSATSVLLLIVPGQRVQIAVDLGQDGFRGRMNDAAGCRR